MWETLEKHQEVVTAVRIIYFFLNFTKHFSGKKSRIFLNFTNILKKFFNQKFLLEKSKNRKCLHDIPGGSRDSKRMFTADEVWAGVAPTFCGKSTGRGANCGGGGGTADCGCGICG